jgi:mannose-6-phosphate isomerase-like protein (cupin superfamily)
LNQRKFLQRLQPSNVVGDEVVVKIASRDTNGTFAVAEGHTPPSGGPPLHRHFTQDEWWYILEGQFLFEVDGTDRPKLSAGGCTDAVRALPDRLYRR